MHLHCGSVIPELAEGEAVGRKGQDVPEKSEEGMGARSKAEGKEEEPRRNRKVASQAFPGWGSKNIK